MITKAVLQSFEDGLRDHDGISSVRLEWLRTASVTAASNQPGASEIAAARPGTNQPGAAGNVGVVGGSARQLRAVGDPGINQPGAAGNVGRDPGVNQPGAAGNRRR